MSDHPVVILLISSQAEDVRLAREAFGQLGAEFRLDLASDLAAGSDRIASGQIDIVLLGLEPADSQGFETLAKTIRHAGGLPVIALSSLDDAEAALRAVREGAHDFLVRGRLSSSSLVRCIRHAIERYRHVAKVLGDGREKARGKVITLLGAKGGVGTTTAVLNLAAALARQGTRTIALELWPYSCFRTHLKTSPDRDLGRLLEVEPTALDSQALEQNLTSLPFGFRALFAPPRGKAPVEVQPQQGASMIRVSGEVAQVVLVDLPSRVSSAHEAAALASDCAVVVLEPEPLCVESAKQAVQTLRDWGVNNSAMGLLVVNRATLTNSLRPLEVRNRVGCEIVGIIPAAAEACAVAFEAGKPLAVLQPDSRFSLAIKEVAEGLTRTPTLTLRF